MPVRKIPKNYRNVTGLAGSSKSEGDAAFESTLERDFYELLEFNNAVPSYEVQPVVIDYLDKLGNSRTYTPDVLVDFKMENGVLKKVLYEVKYRDDLKQNWEEYKPKIKAAIRLSKNRGWRFKIITEQEIRTDLLKNVRFLLPFKRNALNHAHEKLLLTRLAEMRETDPQSLLIAIYRDRWAQAELLTSLWRLVSFGSVGVDLMLPLTMTSRIWSKDNG